MENCIEIIIETPDEETKEMIMALLAAADFDGFEETENFLKAYCAQQKFDEVLLNEILQPFDVKFKTTIIAAQNWNAVWESNFEPVVIEDFVAVRASFHKKITGVLHEIVITPKMSFGTGHHATTFMMMQQMHALDFENKTVFDFGTGTGILAILAEKLGAKKVFAIDNDEWSFENASENIVQNNCSKINLQLLDTPQTDETFDIILANINKNIILEYLRALVKIVKQKGIILLSGLLAEDEADIAFAGASLSLSLQKKLVKDKWICLCYRLEL